MFGLTILAVVPTDLMVTLPLQYSNKPKPLATDQLDYCIVALKA